MWGSVPGDCPSDLLQRLPAPPLATECLLLCAVIQIGFKPPASVLHCNALFFIQHQIRDRLRPRVANIKEEERFANPNENEFLFFPRRKKKKRKYEGVNISFSENRKILAMVRRLKQAALRVKTKHSDTPLHLSPACFIILDIQTVCPWDAFGCDNPASLEIEYQRRGGSEVGEHVHRIEKNKEAGVSKKISPKEIRYVF